ncbi:hypothetical protein V5799_022441 [Amblyomma americanum]|uniref:Uncharacterized protein n=1 Tax=Amblyomma americanum TaxID=6943 RepID=A0AAQ4FKH9_AMBAM
MTPDVPVGNNDSTTTSVRHATTLSVHQNRETSKNGETPVAVAFGKIIVRLTVVFEHSQQTDTCTSSFLFATMRWCKQLFRFRFLNAASVHGDSYESFMNVWCQIVETIVAISFVSFPS